MSTDLWPNRRPRIHSHYHRIIRSPVTGRPAALPRTSPAGNGAVKSPSPVASLPRYRPPESGRRTISPITDAGRLDIGQWTVDSRTVDSGTGDNAARARSPSGVAPGWGSSCPLRYPADQGSERSGRGQMVPVRSQADRSQLGKQPAAGGGSGRLAGVGVRVWVASEGSTWHGAAVVAWVSRSL